MLDIMVLNQLARNSQLTPRRKQFIVFKKVVLIQLTYSMGQPIILISPGQDY